MRIRCGRGSAAVALAGAVFLASALLLAADEPLHYSLWSAPINLGPIINTSGNDSGPCISRDGLSLYFNSDRPGGFGSSDLYVTHRARADDPWGVPVNLGPNVNSTAGENACALSSDEHRIYFHSNRPGGLGGTDLWVARRHNRREDANWQPAQNLGSPVNTSATEAFSDYFEDDATGKITLYFASNRSGDMGGLDIYASTLQPDETWSAPVIVPALNSAYDDIQPSVSRDGLELFLSSNRPGSYGVYDIWVSTRASATDPWSTPVNLGPVVNSLTPSMQGRPAISFDGTALYFYSSRPDGFGSNDIYVSTRTKLKR